MLEGAAEPVVLPPAPELVALLVLVAFEVPLPVVVVVAVDPPEVEVVVEPPPWMLEPL